mmetsp:Transcript_37052/g.118809  ORF Transcript_37052/g.118809 Transcript_37052/m.118809 type:complete len:279 (-) Transcript_37052:1143-1979(-)
MRSTAGRSLWIDTHGHPQLGRPAAHSASVVVVSTHRGDWPRVRGYGGRVFGRAYGVHPWWCDTVESDATWFEDLEAFLREEPSAIVGEIGLDGLRGAQNKDLQSEVFERQFRLAADLGRPATVHCVRAFGALREAFEAAPRLPPRISMHSYGGSFDFARDLGTLARRRGSDVFFGFSWVVNGKKKRQLDLIHGLPDDAILLETDLEDPSLVDDHLRRIRDLVATAKGWSQDDTLRICHDNALRFLLDQTTPTFDVSPEEEEEEEEHRGGTTSRGGGDD